MDLVIIFLSAAVGIGRFFIPGHALSLPGTYEAFAHIWVGVLLALSFQKKPNRVLAIASLLIITAIETVKFLLFKANN